MIAIAGSARIEREREQKRQSHRAKPIQGLSGGEKRKIANSPIGNLGHNAKCRSTKTTRERERERVAAIEPEPQQETRPAADRMSENENENATANEAAATGGGWRRIGRQRAPTITI